MRGAIARRLVRGLPAPGAGDLPPHPTLIVLSPESRFFASGGAKVGDADGRVLCEQTMTPTLESCRALLACGVTGQFEVWYEGDNSFARLDGRHPECGEARSV